MAVAAEISVERENAAIDMMVSMVAEDLSEELQMPVEEVLPLFLQSRTCATLCDRKTKLWWDGPSEIVSQYLAEIERKGVPETCH